MEGAEVSSEAVGIRFLALGLQSSVGKKDATTHRIGFRVRFPHTHRRTSGWWKPEL